MEIQKVELVELGYELNKLIIYKYLIWIFFIEISVNETNELTPYFKMSDTQTADRDHLNQHTCWTIWSNNKCPIYSVVFATFLCGRMWQVWGVTTLAPVQYSAGDQ